ncbi:hypothetical protein ACWGKS_22505 [Nocardiopsis sp. NPDC055879]
MTKRLKRWTVAATTALGIAVMGVATASPAAAEEHGRPTPPPGMERACELMMESDQMMSGMHEQMMSDNPGMGRMHERMMGDG